MVPNVTATGRSFNGAFAYYLHDKRQEGEARRDTADRVAWTETRNLATDDPDQARRVMIATARQADALKKAAGVRSAGRKSSQHVYAYSLSWSTAEAGQIDRAEMRRAVEASLKALRAEHLQAVIVAHRDTQHPHVHVILNRVDPATGKLHSLSNDHHRLDAWALAYRQARGEEHKYCPARAEKAAARRLSRELGPVFTRSAETRPTRRIGPELARAAAPGNDNQVHQARAAELAKRTAAMRERHATEWRDLSAGLKAARSAAFKQANAARTTARESVKEEFRPFWRDLYQRQTAERTEQRLQGVLALAWTAWTTARAELGDKIDKSFLSSVFRYVVSKEAREAHLAKRHEAEQRKLGTAARREIDHRDKSINTARDNTIAHERKAFAQRRLELIERQTREKAEARQAWRELAAAKAARRIPHARTAAPAVEPVRVVTAQPVQSRPSPTPPLHISFQSLSPPQRQASPEPSRVVPERSAPVAPPREKPQQRQATPTPSLSFTMPAPSHVVPERPAQLTPPPRADTAAQRLAEQQAREAAQRQAELIERQARERQEAQRRAELLARQAPSPARPATDHAAHQTPESRSPSELSEQRARDSASRHFQTPGEIRDAAGVGDRQPRRDRDRSRSRSRSRSRTRGPDDGG
jgi:hypothetical protein